MEANRFREIALSLESWRFDRKGTEGYVVELRAAADELDIAESEMFDFFMQIFLSKLGKQWKAQAQAATETLHNKSVEELELSVRAYNCLKNAGIRTVGDISSMTDDSLLRIRNMGRKNVKEIRDAIARLTL